MLEYISLTFQILVFLAGVYIHSNIFGLITYSILFYRKYKYFYKFDWMLVIAPYLTSMALLFYNGDNKSLGNAVVEPLVVSLLSLALVLVRPKLVHFISLRYLSILSTILLCVLSVICYLIMPPLPE